MNETIPIIRLGRLSDIPPGHGKCYTVEDEEIAVFRQRGGSLFAVQNRCPHRQGPLSDGICGGGKIICPLHGHKFDLATGQGSEPNEHLKVYRVTEIDGELQLEWAGDGGIT
jgi:nitrite reductase (NADH) small subunit